MLPTLSDALAAQGYDTLTPVQEAVTDAALITKDLLVSAQTGSGKTVGFGLALGPTLLDEPGHFERAAAPLALIIAPTRELALQVKRELSWLYGKAGAVLASCVGGMDMRNERRALERGAHVVVATPGRLKDHILRGSIDLSAIRAIVLDEADEMLDLGFREDLEFILAEAPDDRRTLMFSATVPPMIEKLAKTYQRDATRISTIQKAKQHADITYQALPVLDRDADNAIINVLRYHEAPNAIVFANTRAMVTRLTTRLSNRGFAVVALSGELSQTERSHALQAMRDGRARVCVATDVAARGIDLPNLELVIHAELPTNAETLMHRSGRTGRAGRKGISAMIVTPKFRKRAQNLLKWGKLTADWTTPPTADEVRAKDEERLINDPVWTDPLSEQEESFAAQLTERYTPTQIAVAALRFYGGKGSAPEDIEILDPDAPPPPREKGPRKEREPFGPSRWLRLDLGREGKAEARWLLPMICKAGGITKKEIGAIRIHPTETFVEIRENVFDRFIADIGPEMRLENQASLTVIDGAPPRQNNGKGPRPPRKHEGRPDVPLDNRKEDAASAHETKPKKKPRPAFDPKSQDAPRKPKGKKPSHKSKGPGQPKDKGKGKGKPRAAASDTSKRFTPPGKARASKRGGDAPPRRSRNR